MKYDNIRILAITGSLDRLGSLSVAMPALETQEVVASARDAITELWRELTLKTLAYNGMKGLLLGRRADVNYLHSMLEEVYNALERNLDDGETALEIAKEALEAIATHRSRA